MKRIYFLAVMCSSYIVAFSQNQNIPYLTKSLSAANIRSVDMQTSGGSLSVEGVNSADAKLEVYVHGNNGNKNLSKEEIDRRIKEGYDLNITTNGGQLVVVAKQKKGFNDWKKSLSISFKAYVPKNASTSLRTSGGSLSLSGLTGVAEGNTSGGSIRLSNMNNSVNMKTSGGSISAENSSGNINLTTSGGSINLSDLKGAINAVTSGGSIKADGVNGELLAKTSGGSIRVDRMEGSVDLATSAGSTSVNMLSVDKYVKIAVSAGQVNLHLPKNKGMDLDLRASKVNLPSVNNFSGSQEKEKVTGKLNGGGVPVEVAVSSGSLNVETN
ncbi:DUF4097 family beta strand repeat-containing protein [Olivibacter domesticus]|uniref:Putative adhesin n=1 Tax=Olivibacter domesticus TaxID=407022 RepID=A0A1H7SIG1_OLID1|nr:DUF4097 family beta strand repeat-containing protein [Olivibacter domesticus]SEL72471.1 Putative adhesin [Olivibacter domesticus]